jgi:hypothetical protein
VVVGSKEKAANLSDEMVIKFEPAGALRMCQGGGSSFDLANVYPVVATAGEALLR